MKFLIVTSIFPPDIGGPATYVPRIANELSERGHDITVITHSEEVYQKDDNKYNFRLVRIKRGRFMPIRTLETIFKVILYGIGQEVLYVNGLGLESALSNLVLRKPLFMRVVGDWAWERSRNKGYLFDNLDKFQISKYSYSVEILRRVRKWFTGQATSIITPSKYFKNIITGWGVDTDNIHVIYNPIADIDHNLIESKIVNDQRENEKLVVTVCRLVNWKGVDGIIEAISDINQVKLLIIGDGPYKEILEKQVVDLKLNNRVEFTGILKHEDVLNFIKSTDLLVLNSIYECFPFVVLEAMQMGIPVVVTNVGSLPELVEDGVNGIVIEPDDHEGLKQAILKLINNKQLSTEYAENAKKRLNNYSMQNAIDKTLRLFENNIPK